MCGILGYIGNKEVKDGLINKVLKLMRNRGPDHQGFKKFKFGNKKV